MAWLSLVRRQQLPHRRRVADGPHRRRTGTCVRTDDLCRPGRVDAHDAGAASGLINTFHQLGSALGLGILVTLGTAAVPAGTSGVAALVDRVSAALTGGTVVLAVALLAVLALIARRGTTHAPKLPAEPSLERQTHAAVLELHS